MKETYAEITDLIYVNYFVTKGIESYCSGNIGFIQSADERIIMERIYLTLIPSSLLLAGSLLISAKTLAQVTSDNTLSTVVISPDGSNFTIEGGNRPNGGGNLFHSFRDFSVPTNGSAVFNNANDIANIISRVTGGNFSSIDGLIRANGNANLFLINPAGIIFGQNARLDIGGSFFGSTADSLLFPEGEFSAVDTQAPPLLTVNIPIGLRFRDNPGNIVNQSIATNNFGLPFGLQVNPGQTLALMGGDIFFAGGKITSPGSNIELGGLLTTGTIKLDDNFKLSFPEGIERANVFFNAAEVNVASNGGGSIHINAGNINLSGESQLLGGITQGLGNLNSQAGNIILNATGDISLDRSSRVQNQVEANATGNAGSINVTTNNLFLTDGSQILNLVVGRGNSGIVKIITSENISIDGENLFGRNSGIFNNVQGEGVGNAGGVEIITTNLNLTNGGTVSASTFAQGNGGKVNINAADTISIDDQAGLSSGIFSNVGTGALGNTEGIEITTTNLNLTTGGIVSSSTFGEGNAGNINIEARSLSLDNGAVINSSTFGQGDSGIVSITTEEAVTLSGAGTIISNNVERGGVGNSQGISIEAQSLSVTDGGQIQTLVRRESEDNPAGVGNAGDINIEVRDKVTFSRVGLNRDGTITSSRIRSNLETGAVGKAGNINIKARSLLLENGAIVDSSILGKGNAGNIEIEATDSVSLNGSFLSSIVGPSVIGNGADITINTPFLSMANNAAIATSTVGQGNAGNILINATEAISLTNKSQIQAVTFSEGNAGNIVIDAENADILLSNILIATSTDFQPNDFLDNSAIAGNGQGGELQIMGRTLSLNNGAELLTTTGGKARGEKLANAGNIQINISDSITFDSGSRLLSETRGQGNAGNVTINAGGAVSFDGVNSNIESGVRPLLSEELATEFTQERQSGDINIAARSLSINNGASLNTSTFGNGNSGIVSIKIDESVSLSGAGTIIFNNVEQGGVGNSQGIFIEAESLSVTNGAQIQTLVRGESEDNLAGVGNAGDININVRDKVNFSGIGVNREGRTLPSLVTSILGTGAKGKAGDIDIEARSLLIENGASLNTGSFGQGNAGNITFELQDTFNLSGFALSDDGTSIFTSRVSSQLGTGAKGKAGDIDIKVRSLSVQNGASLNTGSFGQGNAGNITLDIQDTLNLSGFALSSDRTIIFTSRVSSELGTGAKGKAGDIDIKVRSLNATNAGQIAATTSGQGDSGNITIVAEETISFDGRRDETDRFPSGIFINVNEGAIGDGGNINLTTGSLKLTNRAQLASNTRGTGKAGNIRINVQDEIFLSNSILISEVTEGLGIGQGGDIIITTGSLLLEDGSALLADTENQGDAGKIDIKAREKVVLKGEGLSASANSVEIVPNQISTTVETNAVGKGGEINIVTPSLLIQDDGFISATTFGTGNAGDLTISTSQLRLEEGGQLEATTFSSGKAGELTVQASQLLEILGTAPDGESPSGIFASAIEGSGDGGNLSIYTNKLVIEDQGTISVGNFPIFFGNSTSRLPGTGAAGSLDIQANSISMNNGTITAANANGIGGELVVTTNFLTLENGSSILADTTANTGTGGNIKLNIDDTLLMRNNSLISGQATEGATGGNVGIIAKFIIAFPSQFDGNDIIASAVEGQGGNINITAEALFGIEERKATPGNETNDIDASSQFGLSGQVNITRPDFDPTSGLLELTEEVVDPSKLIAQNVCTQTANSEFVDIGKGGLPQNPEYVLAENSIEIGLVAPVTASREELEISKQREEVKSSINRKPPAQGWIWHENGMVELVAYNPERKSDRRTWENYSGCQ